ncbi:hypothetical protein ACA910_019328 [Epithemia clementina (nom. ined.)]
MASQRSNTPHKSSTRDGVLRTNQAPTPDEGSLYTAEDSLDQNSNARPPPMNPDTILTLSPVRVPQRSKSNANDSWTSHQSSHNQHQVSVDPIPVPSFRKKARSVNLQVVAVTDDEDNDTSVENYEEEMNEMVPMSPRSNMEHDCVEARSTFIVPGDIHPNMENREDEIAQLRLLAGKLSADWRGSDFMAPALARRIRDFQWAQDRRRKKYGDERPWGILGLYDFLSAIRTDVEWAEDAAWRRANNESYQSWADFDENKKKGYNRPFFTYFLLFVCSVILVASIAVNDWKVEPLDVNPMIGPSAETLIIMGAKDTTLIIDDNEGWRLISSAVLHAGLVHFLVNMLALWFVGGAIETSHGWFAAMVIFCISAVGGTILSGIFLPEYITVGASGGIFGFIGACIADIIMNWNLLFCDFVTENGKKHRHILVFVVLIMDIALNSIIGLTPYVDNFTHLGGMAYGFLCGLSTMERLSSDFFGMEDTVLTQVKHFVIRFFGLILSLVSISVTLAILLNMDPTSTLCPDCTWLSCVPFPPWESEANKWWYCDDCNTVTASIVSQPYVHLEVDCPGGDIAWVNMTNDINREQIQKRLPTYCRDYCPTTKN